MQTTLLGLAIAIILALVSALVAPLVVDWNHYRSAFEAEASRLTGLAVRVNGTIDARILPTPRIKLRDVEVGEPGREPQLRAGAIELEVGLGPLLRGEVQATELRLVAPQISLGIDRSGAIDWPALSPSFRPDTLTISRLHVEDGRVTLTDAGSGARLVLQKLSVQRRYPLVRRAVPGRRRLRRRRRALRLSDIGQSRRRGRRAQAQARRRSRRIVR